MESWRDKLRRESREVHDATVAALAITDDHALRTQLEKLVAMPHFSQFTWLFGPVLAKKHRVMFRPFILSSFSRDAIDSNGNALQVWTGETGAALQHWLEAADAIDDIELTKRLFQWKLESQPNAEQLWRAEIAKRFLAATSPAARHTALAKIDQRDYSLDGATALALWTTDRIAASPFILGHLGWRAEFATWQPLLEASRAIDRTFHFDLYRKLVDEARWRTDVLALPVSPAIGEELQRRHPAMHWLAGAAEVFHELLVKHGAAAIPYVMRHADKVHARYAWGAKREGKGLPDLLDLANERGWFVLWGALLRTSATAELFDKEVRALVDAGARSRLELLPGRGREFHGAGFSFAQVHALADETAARLYARYPALVRGPFRAHVTPNWGVGFEKLAKLAIAAADDDLVDYLASHLALQYNTAKHAAAIETIVAHYAALSDEVFVRRAANALTRMPAHAVWSFESLVKQNSLAKLLFERSTERFLADGAAVRDLLESPQIHVQLLGFRVLAQRDPRAPAIAAAHVDLLQATLLRKLRRATRLAAFGALENAAQHDEPTARYLLDKMRDALALPEKRYPMEKLVGLIGRTLHRWPQLRSAREQPVVWG